MLLISLFVSLSELGEPISVDVSPKDVYMELLSTKALLDGRVEEDVIGAQRMTDKRIRWKLKFLTLLATPTFVLRPHVVPLTGCRTIKLSLQHGFCSDSAVGLQIYGWGVLSFQKDVEEALKWCHAGVGLAKSLKAKQIIPRVKVNLDTISYWKEPLQAKFDSLKENHRDLLMVGEMDQLGANAMHFCRRALLCGQNLLTSEKECAALIHDIHQLRQLPAVLSMISNHVSILTLIGSNCDSEHKLNKPLFYLLNVNSHDGLLQHALSSRLVGPLQQCYFDRLHNAFWLGNYKEAAEYADKYDKCEQKVSKFPDLYKTFYQGISAFRLARLDGTSWKETGKIALSQYQTWVKYSEWNWENKMLLLEAELNSSEGELEVAKCKYQESVESAQKHKFVNEEGLARELSGMFYEENGNKEEAMKQFQYARACYEKWGAFALADRLLHKKIGDAKSPAKLH